MGKTLGVLAVMLLPGAASAASMTYCCNDNAGRKICGDTLPQICYDRAYREISPSGRVTEVEAPLTPEQRAKKDADLKAQRERAIREAEAKRKDRVLLDTYTKAEDIDARRDREIAAIEADIKRLREGEAEQVESRNKLEKQKASYGTVPKFLVEDLAMNASELANTRSLIDGKLRDIEAVKLRYAADRARYIQLSSGKADAR